LPVWNWDTVNFWSQIAFAFSGLELVSAMSQEVRDPQRTLPRAVYASGVLIAGMYIVATVAVLGLVPAAEVSATSGVFHAITVGSIALKIGALGVLAAVVVTVGNAGGVGSTVAGIARVLSWLASTATCRLRSGKFIRAGRRRMFRFWCKRPYRARFC